MDQNQLLVILVVDDDPAMARALARLLRGAGHTVLTAENGQKGLEVLAAQQDENGGVNVVFSDMDMSLMDGLVFLTTVKEKYPTIQRVLMSGDIDRLEIKKARAQKTCQWTMMKPWTEEMMNPITILSGIMGIMAVESVGTGGF